jgi:putative CocE/NonD family hydrolase
MRVDRACNVLDKVAKVIYLYAPSGDTRMRMTAVSAVLLIITALPKAITAAEASRPEYPVRIEFNRHVRMRDGIELSADIYRPDHDGRFPVILTRTPYNKSTDRGGHLETGRYFAARGYVYVAMDVRGRGDSEGKFVPYRNEGPDGYDAIEWCTQQPWSTGKIGTIGASYLGYDQWIAALQQPPHLRTMIVSVTPPDPFVESPTGLQSPTYMSWHLLTSGHTLHNLAAVDWPSIYLHLPVETMDEAAGLGAYAYWRDIIAHPGINSWWDPLIYQNKFERVRIPVMNISGWYDDEQAGAPMNYIGMTTHGATPELRRSQKLLMGPWPHAVNSTQKLGEIDFGPTAVIDLNKYETRWFDYWLKGTDTGIMQEPPVRIFLMGKNAWQDENEWPIARTSFTKYYLHSHGRANSIYGDGTLSTLPANDEPGDKYSYNPMHPTPFIMEPTYAQLGGPDDYRSIERRDDVLVFTSAPLTGDTTVCGPIRANIFATSSAPDTDFMAKLLDVHQDGFAQRLTDGMVRARYREGGDKGSPITPGKIYAYNIDLWNTCQQFRHDHRVRVEISSSAFPKYDRNQNTGEALGKTATIQVALQTILHNAQYPSHIVLPIVPDK